MEAGNRAGVKSGRALRFLETGVKSRPLIRVLSEQC